ncbi:MAG: putative AP-1 complex subunit mu [Streblomastix strix]|uniref:Putative AP-1 complex subunit mu n=1 Tax=Streblomastix strix TaxID=222440 RepID=A0A5J4X062_9EUKA|nr:MAG: putative AP-1 complex subunit mu [Streblomastix strix]
MIDTLIICSGQGDIILEKNFGALVPRSVSEEYFNAANKTDDMSVLKPIIVSENRDTFLFYFKRHNIVYLAATKQECPALLISKFLEHIDLVLCDFFGEEKLDEKIKHQFVALYMVVDELVDGGFPNITEPNLLKELLEPQTFTGIGSGTVASSTVLPDSITSAIFWRKSHVSYMQNEMFIDINEVYNAIFGSDGVAITSNISGEVAACAKLSGLPDLTLHFEDASIMDDVSLHPCVRYFRWMQQKIVSFVPPDGSFTLLKYRAGTSTISIPPPIAVRPECIIFKDNGKFALTLVSRNTQNNLIEQLYIDFVMPSCVSTVDTRCTQGSFSYDTTKKIGHWLLNRLVPQQEVQITGTFHFDDTKTESTAGKGTVICEERPIALIHFQIAKLAISGLRLRSLTLGSENAYKMYKGMRAFTRSGNYEVRF